MTWYDRQIARITKIESQIDSAETALLELTSGTIKSYDWGEDGRQQSVTYTDPKKLKITIDQLYATLERLYANVEGEGNPKVNVRAY